MNFAFFLEIGGAEGKLLSSVESGDESRFTSVSEKKLLVTWLIGSKTYAVSSEVFESELTGLHLLKLISVLLYTEMKVVSNFSVKYPRRISSISIYWISWS